MGDRRAGHSNRVERAASTPLIVMMSDFQTTGTRPIPERATGVLVKPFPLAVMLEEVRRALRARNTAES